MSLYQIARTETGKVISLNAKMANRHGLIAGATGTGKTVTLRKLAESLSDDGVPVFLVDVKGDLSGLVQAGNFSGKIAERILQFNLGGEDYLKGYPVSFWDVFGTSGIPLRTTISEMGPMLLSRLLNLNDTQGGLLNLVFRVADDRGLAFLLWFMAELFENLPEVGDPEKPTFVLFFDEAHLLFDDAPKALVDKIEQVVRLIRSKGVGVYFVTQNPLDLPDSVLGQLGNRIQHALRAFTPCDQKAVKSAAETFRANKEVNVVEAITQLGVGQALVSVLDEKGMPTPVEIAYIYPPKSQLAPLAMGERDAIVKQDELYHHYSQYVNNQSAFELLNAKAEAIKAEQAAAEEANNDFFGGILSSIFGSKKKKDQSITEQVVSQVAHSVGRNLRNQVTKQIMRGILGAITKK
ncbi:TPA: DUF853 family protein [Mannheimia haemolytica]|nr:DUF853 family protein [Mannheimia haemolytica]